MLSSLRQGTKVTWGSRRRVQEEIPGDIFAAPSEQGTESLSPGGVRQIGLRRRVADHGRTGQEGRARHPEVQRANSAISFGHSWLVLPPCEAPVFTELDKQSVTCKAGFSPYKARFSIIRQRSLQFSLSGTNSLLHVGQGSLSM